MLDNDVVNVAAMRANVTSLSEIRPLWGSLGAQQSFVGIAAGPGCLMFLWAYTAIHLAHERGVYPTVARAISGIPLFSTFILGLATAVAASIVVLVVHRLTGLRLRATPRLLAYSIGLFGAVMVLFP